MSTPKFKIGDRVKWKDFECQVRSGVIVGPPCGRNTEQFRSLYVKEAQELPPGRWHESHLSLDVPEAAKATKFKVGDRVRRSNVPGWVVIQRHASDCYTVTKKFEYRNRVSGDDLSLDAQDQKKHATDLEAQLGAQIIKQHRAIIAFEKALAEAREQVERLQRIGNKQAEECMHLSNRLSEEIGKNLLFHEHLNDVQTECVRRGDLLNAIPKPPVEALAHLSNRLTEEIGGRARERISKETAEKQLLHASELLICETESFSKERRLREAVQGDNRRLIDSKMTLLQEVDIERKAKEAAQRELAKANDSLRFQRLELRKAMEDRSVEWMANGAAKKELADVRKDLADLRTISKRLAL